MKLLHKQISMGWMAWRDMYLDIVKERIAMQYAFSKMLQRQLCISWNSWRAVCKSMRDLVVRQKHAVAMLQQARVFCVLDNWRQRLREAHAWDWCLTQVKALAQRSALAQEARGMKHLRFNVLSQKAATRGFRCLFLRVFRNRVRSMKATQLPLNRAVDSLVTHLSQRNKMNWNDALYVANELSGLLGLWKRVHLVRGDSVYRDVIQACTERCSVAIAPMGAMIALRSGNVCKNPSKLGWKERFDEVQHVRQLVNTFNAVLHGD